MLLSHKTKYDNVKAGNCDLPGPALLVVVAHDVLVVGVGVLGEVALDEILGLLCSEAEEHVHLVDVAREEADGVPSLGPSVPESQELVGDLQDGRKWSD